MGFGPGTTSVLVALTLAVIFGCARETDSTLAGDGQEANSVGAVEATASDPPRRGTVPSRSALDAATGTTLFGELVQYAEDLARVPFVSPASISEGPLADLDYEQYRSIRFRPGAGIWHGETRFQIDLFHPGFSYAHPVRLHVLESVGPPTSVAFDPSLFDYFGVAEPLREVVARELDEGADSTLGYAGFRVHTALNSPEGLDETLVFLGDAYFRMLGRGHVHGLSARGLAVDVALPSGEEFPAFREFWLQRPEPESDSLTILALLDSPSVAGAYEFLLIRGERTTLVVDALVFAREDIAKIGVAPLTSMFLFGPNEAGRFDDFRPRVHDSDGLSMLNSRGEWIWRPLSNGPGLQVTSLRDVDPRGFGLVQRQRAFDDYLDMEAQYHRRPSVWVEVEGGDWGAGGVELVEIPTPSEFNDNIVASWVPDRPFRQGESRRFRYRLVALDDVAREGVPARVERTRIGRDALPGEASPRPPSHRRIVVDFGPSGLDGAGDGDVTGVLTTTAGTTEDLVVQRLPDEQGWRASFRLVPDGDRIADMRLYLEMAGEPISETWTYVWRPGGAA
ncbi:MAG: glucan biosynthesis protein [Gemmatimonadetes bacterium]|nr:glucan biosynthesis protein [Gemmatimonadota bacterium]